MVGIVQTKNKPAHHVCLHPVVETEGSGDQPEEGEEEKKKRGGKVSKKVVDRMPTVGRAVASKRVGLRPLLPEGMRDGAAITQYSVDFISE